MLNFIFTKTPLVFLYQSLWRDEAFSYVLAHKNIGELLIATAKDFNPPFYYLLLKLWMLVFGKSEIALRSLSLIGYWLTVYVGYLFLVNVFKFSRKKSYLYLLLIAINPLLVYYALEVRMYSLFAFLVSLSFYALIRKKKRLYLTATIIGLYTHYFMIFAVGGQLLFSFISDPKKERRDFIKQLLFCGFAFLPWVIFFLKFKDFQTANGFWILKQSLPQLIDLAGIIYTGYEKSFLFFEKNLTNLSAAIFLIIAFSLIKQRFSHSKNKSFIALLLIWAMIIPVGVLVFSYVKPIFLPRYLIFTTVGLILLIIYALDQFNLWLRLFIVIPLILITINYHQLQIKEREKVNFRKLFREINQLAGKNDAVYVTNELDYFTAQYYFGENRVFIYGKTYQEIPAFVGKVLIPKASIVTQLPTFPKKAFLINSDYSYNIQAEF